MVVGEPEPTAKLPTQQVVGTPQATIDNIMSGIGNTGTVKMNNHRKKLRQRFDIIKKLGQGTYGKVQLGINKETGQEVAIKTIKKCKIETEADLIRIRREVQIMSSVQHPNIIHIYEVFENREKMVLVMEFAAGGELYDYLSERKVLAEDEARRVFRQIATAVYYCHKHKICHRDLKLENILLDENGNAKIADFGLSNVFDDQRLLATFCGSPLYASPEIVKGTPYQGPEVDCWSLGVLLYTLVYGAMPFDGSNFKRLVKQISQGDYYEPKKPSPASPLIREMLTVCPKRRATIEQICNHWWVNEGYQGSCLDLAEELANQTPVRLDVLLSLAPSSITADQLVVPGPEESKSTERVPRSHSVGSIIDIASTEAERRIIDMVQAGGEAALMPSPTRTITPAESPAQPKRKLETTISMENASGAKKKEKAMEHLKSDLSKKSIPETMDVDITNAVPQNEPILEGQKQNEITLSTETLKESNLEKKVNLKKKVISSLNNEGKEEEPIKTEPCISPNKTVKKVVGKNQTSDVVAAISEVGAKTDNEESKVSATDLERKNSLIEENLLKPTERHRSRIAETAEKFQNLANQGSDKPKKFVVPGTNVGGFKKDNERKSSLPSIPSDRKLDEKEIPEQQEKIVIDNENTSKVVNKEEISNKTEVQASDSKSSIHSFSLEEARKSMENSIALLNKARNESNSDVDQLCAKTENVSVTDEAVERQQKLKNAREIIGNAIQPGRLCMGVRKPPVPFGMNGRSISGSVVPPSTTSGSISDKKSMRIQVGPDPKDYRTATFSVSSPEQKMFEQEPFIVKPIARGTLVEPPENENTMKTSRAEIVLKSATLPRRKTTKAEIQLEIKPTKSAEPSMRFSTEMQHQVPDLRSAPIHEHPTPYSPIVMQQRATSLEPQVKEFFVPIARPPSYTRTGSNTFRPGSLSRQSTNDSDTDTTTTQSQTPTPHGSNNQPIKKSPREFIIPIAVEGGGYITPRASSLEPSESLTSNSTFRSNIRPKRIGSIINERDSEEDSLFNKLHRHTSIGKESDNDEPRFHSMHRLRSTRPIKKISQDPTDSASSGEDDDEDGFEILTAENLFSTLLQRVRALTNRINVNNDTTSGFPSSRFISNLRQTHSPFWHHDPFGSRLNNGNNPWRTTISRDLNSDIDSMFSRSGATLPRGTKFKSKSNNNNTNTTDHHCNLNEETGDNGETLDLGDLDLSQLRLSKKDLETLSSLTPALSKRLQDQLLAQLPPNQARKLSRTLSMQNNATRSAPTKFYKRSLSGGRDIIDDCKPDLIKDVSSTNSNNNNREIDRNSIFRKSLSKTRYDKCSDTDINDKELRNLSLCRDSACYSDDMKRSMRSSYSSDYEKPPSPYRYYDTLPTRVSCMSPTKDYLSRPPSGCLSPPPITADTTLRRRSSHRRISRFLRPDFFDTPREESIYVTDQKLRDPESQKILRDIRERSRERSIEKRETNFDGRYNRENSADRLSYFTEKYSSDKIIARPQKIVIPDVHGNHKHNVNCPKYNPELTIKNVEQVQSHRRNLSKSKELQQDVNISSIHQEASFADKILNELQSLSTKASNVVDNNEKPNDAVEIKNQKITKVKKPKSIKSDMSDTGLMLASPIVDKKLKKKKSKSNDINPKSIDCNSSFNDTEMVKNFTNQINSVNLLTSSFPNLEKQESTTGKVRKESKLLRPKSYPSKEPENIKKNSPDKKMNPVSENEKDLVISTDPVEKVTKDKELNDKSAIRPKSFPHSKLTPPKDVKKAIENNGAISTEIVDKLIDKNVKTTIKLKSEIENSSPPKCIGDIPGTNSKTTVKKVVKLVKKSPPKTDNDKILINDKTMIAKNVEKKEDTKVITEKSSEKKNKGFLYSISQKFEKLKENSKIKDKKSPNNSEKHLENSNSKNTIINSNDSNKLIASEKSSDVIKKIKISKLVNENITNSRTEEKPSTKSECKSKIDAMIRNLRERSMPRNPVITESGLIKRAVSVEDMSGAFNKSGVSKVLGLFKRIESENVSSNKVVSTKSSCNISLSDNLSFEKSKERPKSSGFASKLRKGYPYTGAKSDTIITITERLNKQQSMLDKINGNNSNCGGIIKIPSSIKYSDCPECCQEEQELVTKRHSSNEMKQSMEEKERIKNNRKGLMLDFTKLDNSETAKRYSMGEPSSSALFLNNSYASNMNGNNNCGYDSTIIKPEINQNHLFTPSYSSDSRSPYDDCGASSVSTFLSPTEEPELYFDEWSVCSDDHLAINTSSPTLRYSHNSQRLESPSQDPNSESIVDRIRRKSFYSRFNEKKPKRVSTIVGPAAKDYYRETAARNKSRPPEHIKSSTETISDDMRNVHEYYRPIRPVMKDNSLASNHNRTNSVDSNDYLKIRHSSHVSDYLPPASTSIRRYNYDPSDYKKYVGSTDLNYRKHSDDLLNHLKSTRVNAYSDNSSNAPVSTSIYGTYNPKKRVSYTATNGPSSLDNSYATLTRKNKAYDQRSVSLIDSGLLGNSTSGLLKREQRIGIDLGGISRSNLRIRTPSVPRSPTNM